MENVYAHYDFYLKYVKTKKPRQESRGVTKRSKSQNQNIYQMYE